MTEELTDRHHKGLYALYIAAQKLHRKGVTTSELYDYAGEVQGVTLLQSEEDTAALLSTFRDRGHVTTTGKLNGAYQNQLTDSGMELLEDAETPDGIDPDDGA